MAAAKLRCEELGERVVPALTYFAFDGGSGFFDYDDAAADAADPDQEVDMSDIGFTYGGSTYTGGDLVSGAIVKLEYGRPSGFVFEVVDVPNLAVQVSAGGYTVVTVDPHGTPSPTIPWPGTTIYGHGPPTLDTSGESTGETFRFTLADGTVVTGGFALDTAEVVSNGSADLTDLTITVGETEFTIGDFDGTPAAVFSGGVFVGLDFDLTSVPGGTPFDELSASGDGTVTATVDSTPQVKPLIFGHDDVARFLLSNGAQGTIAYDVPWDYVDPEEATQSLPLSNFAVTLGGQTLTESNATFTTSPTAEFEYGEFVGITFDIDTSGISGYSYAEVAMAGLTVSATNAYSTVYEAAVVGASPSSTINFTPIRTDVTYTVTVTIITTTTPPGGGFTVQTSVTLGPYTVRPGTTAHDLRDDIQGDLEDRGFRTQPLGNDRLRIYSEPGKPVRQVIITFSNGVDGNNQPVPAANLTPPTLTQSKGVPVFLNGTQLKK